jgi:two-component system KDP operon response regulator KdpE
MLVVDDEKALREFVQRNLEVRGNTVFTASNGLEALAIFEREFIDMVILDLMMPNMDGLETIKRIRQVARVPIIVLSALGEEADKVQALNRGADDYLTKPFGVDELLARVRAVKRRSTWLDQPSQGGQVTQGEIQIDLDRHAVLLRGEPVELTPTEFSLLLYLMENAGKVLAHEVILHNVWGPEYGQEAEYLRVYLGRLRKKFECGDSPRRYFHTERGVGYCFETRSIS